MSPSPLGSDFAGLLAAVRPAIEARLQTLWERKLAARGRHGAEVTAMIDAGRDLTLRGGKRFRAALLAAAYIGTDPDGLLEPAFAGGVCLELLQSYLLIQDDWIDGDVTRRGGPSAHVLLTKALGGNSHLGVSTAILSSDFTWGLALDVLAHAELPAARVLAAIQLLAKVHEDVVVGQQIDIIGRAEDVEEMHALKTGSYTVSGPLALGATLAGASPEVLAALEVYAAPVGVAFQLRDDLLGTFGSEEETGKPVGNDLKNGKRTVIIAEALREGGRLDDAGKQALARAFGRADASPEDVAVATYALEAAGARKAVTERLVALCNQAEALAAGLPLAEPARTMLAGAAAALRWTGKMGDRA